jgi:hypothetical protein
MSLRATLLTTTRNYTQAHSSRNIKTVLSLCAPECIHGTGPLSIRGPLRNNEEYAAFNVEVWTKMLLTYLVNMTDIVVEEALKTVVYMDCLATADAGEYVSEYVIKLKLSDDGRKVVDQG